MTIFAASPSSASTLRRRLLGVTLVSMASLALAAPAQAIVTTLGGATVGIQPRVSNAYLEGSEPGTYSNPQGNPVVHGSNTWVIYWDPTGDSYHNDWQNLIDEYMQVTAANSGGGNDVFAVDTQYTDKTNVPASYKQTFRGAAVDYHAYPANGCEDPNPFKPGDRIGRESEEGIVCLTSAQVAAELERFLTEHGLPRGMNQIYYLLTPPGVTMCLDEGGAKGHCSDFAGTEESYENSFCSYHGAINPGSPASGSASTVLYGAIPWSAGGFGDFHLLAGDRTPGLECQDAGFDASKNEEPEEKPVEEEPNQQGCPNEDGTCDHGLADLIVNQLSLEQQDIVTDPLLNSWQDKGGYENTDECRFFFAPATGSATSAGESKAGTLHNQEYGGRVWYLNDAFNFAAELFPSFPGVPCMPGIDLVPRFTAPSPVNAGETVGFDGMESDITQNAAIDFPGGGAPAETYATYQWNFGDGTPVVTGFAPGSPTCETPWLSPCAATVFHSYQYGGEYQVTLTVTDTGGHTAQITHEVSVNGPHAPASASGAGAGAGGGTSGGSHAVPAPLAAAAIVSRSLKKALRSGLAVRYSVNEKVAGHFEVLLGKALAQRLHLGGPTAANLPAGTPTQVVIAKAIIVTTKGGRSTISIRFSKKTAKRLAHLSSASLMLRMVVRNAASSEPQTAVVLSKATLSH